MILMRGKIIFLLLKRINNVNENDFKGLASQCTQSFPDDFNIEDNNHLNNKQES